MISVAPVLDTHHPLANKVLGVMVHAISGFIICVLI